MSETILNAPPTVDGRGVTTDAVIAAVNVRVPAPVSAATSLGAPASEHARRTRAVAARLRSPVLQFALSGLLAAAVIGAVAMKVGNHIGTDTAIYDAKRATRIVGEGIIAPAVQEGLAQGSPIAIDKLDGVVRTHLLPHGVVRVKLWAGDGRIVYSDKRELIGRRFDLGGEERAAIMSGKGVDAEVSELARPENRFEDPAENKLLEVYLPITGADGNRYLFEVYQGFSKVSAGGERVWTAFAPPLLGLLVLLQLVNLPLARSFAGRLRRASEERAALLQRAVDASDTERRTIAADLHDGVVQDLASVCIGLSARADEMEAAGNTAAGEALREGAAETRAGVRALRTLLVDIYPPTLQRAGLVPALEDLAATGKSRGIETAVSCTARLALQESQSRLLYRFAQEALRNVFKHACAKHVWIVLTSNGGEVRLDVADDGAGFDPALAAQAPADGHIGLRALSDLAQDAGGRLEVASEPGRGAVISVCLPC